jgi:hypothetical protein
MPTVLPHGRPTVKAGTVPGSRSVGAVVVVVATGGDVVLVDGNVEPVGPVVVDGAALAASGDGEAGASSRVTRYTPRPRMNPAATIMITRPARSFTLRPS